MYRGDPGRRGRGAGTQGGGRGDPGRRGRGPREEKEEGTQGGGDPERRGRDLQVNILSLILMITNLSRNEYWYFNINY